MELHELFFYFSCLLNWILIAIIIIKERRLSKLELENHVYKKILKDVFDCEITKIEEVTSENETTPSK